MRLTLLVTALLVAPAALALLAPTAAAQVGTQAPSTTQIKIKPFDGALEPETPTQTEAQIDYSYFVLGGLAMTPTKITIKVTDAPPWAVVHVSPSTVLMPIHFGGTSMQQQAPSQTISVTVSLTEDAPPGATATVRVVAVADANQPIAPSNGEDSVLVQVSDHELCHHAADAEGDVVVLEEKDSDDVTTQSIGAVPVATTSLAAALGAVGAVAGAGYALRRRKA